MHLVKLLLAGLLGVLFITPLHAQQSVVADSLIDARIDSAWSKISELEDAKRDSLQRFYAKQFYQYYLEHPETEGGNDAIISAFRMWGNTNSVNQIDKALPNIPDSSQVWSAIIISIGNGYSGSARTASDYLNLLHKLNETITNPAGRSKVLEELGEYYQAVQNSNRNVNKAREIYKEMIRLQADSSYVAYAREALYEINKLGIGKPAPTFIAETINGDTINLSKLKGKVILLDFWATWCGPCIPEIPHLKEIQRKYGDQDFILIGISLDYKLSDLKKFIQKREMNWVHIWQKQTWNDALIKLYNVDGIPDTYLINRKGIIVAKNLRGERLEKAVAELMQQ